MKQRLLIWALTALLAGLVMFALLLVFKPVAPQAGSEEAFPIGGPYELTAHDGTVKTEQDFAGRVQAIYFGFTYCPDVCPNSLGKLIAAMDTMAPGDADQIQPVLITVDPARDTPAALNDYVSLFHPRLVGLTGTQAQIDDVLKLYRVFASRVESEDHGDYLMDHSSIFYLLNREGTPIGFISGSAPIAEIATRLKEVI